MSNTKHLSGWYSFIDQSGDLPYLQNNEAVEYIRSRQKLYSYGIIIASFIEFNLKFPFNILIEGNQHVTTEIESQEKKEIVENFITFIQMLIEVKEINIYMCAKSSVNNIRLLIIIMPEAENFYITIGEDSATSILLNIEDFTHFENKEKIEIKKYYEMICFTQYLSEINK